MGFKNRPPVPHCNLKETEENILEHVMQSPYFPSSLLNSSTTSISSVGENRNNSDPEITEVYNCHKEEDSNSKSYPLRYNLAKWQLKAIFRTLKSQNCLKY